MKHLFFDLDGTLLPMVQDEFVNYYFRYLAKRMGKHGIDPKQLVDVIWKGTYAMYGNDGACTNEDAFWKVYEKLLGIQKETYFYEFEDFYANEFNLAIAATKPNPELVQRIIAKSKEEGHRLFLATNPIFPQIATNNRIGWAGLKPDDFEIITTYEDCHYSKPNPMYFKEICDKAGIDPKDCVMIGNDYMEDCAAKKLGMMVVIITDYSEHRDAPHIADYEMTLQQLIPFIENLD